MRFQIKAVIAAVGLFWGSQVQAANLYIGGGLGNGQVENYCQNVSSAGCEDSGTAGRLFGGLQMGRFFALELSLNTVLGLETPPSRIALQDGDTDILSLGFNVLGFVPLSERIKLYGGLAGAVSAVTTDVSESAVRPVSTIPSLDFDWFDDDNFDDDDGDGFDDNSDADLESSGSVDGSFLLGVELKFSERVKSRAQWQSIRSLDGGDAFGKDRNVDMFTVNLLWTF